jgi:hypothetical protein
MLPPSLKQTYRSKSQESHVIQELYLVLALPIASNGQ